MKVEWLATMRVVLMDWKMVEWMVVLMGLLKVGLMGKKMVEMLAGWLEEKWVEKWGTMKVE